MSHIQKFRLSRESAGLLVIDVQERLASAMPEVQMFNVRRNVRVLIEGAEALGVPVIVTEQYPKGIGRTLPDIQKAFPEGVVAQEKVDFSCCAVPGILEQIQASKRTQWIVCGMETHICVFQTVRDLLEQNYSVSVVRDAVISRTKENFKVGLDLIESAGGQVSSTETVLFDMLKKAGTPEFKVISRLIK